MTQGRQSVVVIGVTYESDAAALRFVRSLDRISKPVNVAVVLVDNTDRPDSSDLFGRIHAVDSNVICLKAPSNLGYFGGASFGFTEYLRNRECPDWVIVSNVDIEFKDDTFFTHLCNICQTGAVGVIAPSIWSNRYKHNMNPQMVSRPSKRRMQFYRLLYGSFYATRLYVLLSKTKYMFSSVLKGWRRPPHAAAAGNDLRFIYAPHGSCIIFTKLYFLRGGSLNYPSFLFHEEIYVAETARAIGLRVAYAPQLEVHHDDHVSTDEYRSRKIISYLYQSTVLMAKTYFD